MIEIRIQLNNLDGMPQSAIYLVAKILRGGEASEQLRQQVLAAMPAEVQMRVLELIGFGESAAGTVNTPIDLIKTFLTEIEAQVQPLYQQAMDLSLANRLEELS